MGQGLRDNDTITCYNCEEEFTVVPTYETDAEICFCPYCSAALDEEFEDLDIDLDDEDNRD